MSITRPHLKDTNYWEPADEKEIDRLQKRLQPYLKQMGINMSKEERSEFVIKTLESQDYTCILGKKNKGKYCWNEPKYNFKKDENGVNKECICPKLILQWGHLTPRCRNEELTIDALCLMCGRCNNHIQSSRKLEQLVPELISKTSEIIKLVPLNYIKNKEEIIKDLDEIKSHLST